MRILNVEPPRYSPDALALLAGLGEIDTIDCDDQPAFVSALGSRPYDAVLVRIGLAVNGAALDASPGLRWVVTATTGLDHIDVDEAHARGIEIVSLRGETPFLEGVHATAEHTWGLLLALCRRIHHAHASVVMGGWRRGPLGLELHGRTLGIVGYGRLGRMVAAYGTAFGMRVLACDRVPAARGPRVEDASIDELLASADVVSLHLPLDASTTGFLSADRIGAMRPGALLVNTARGELVHEAALLQALRSGRLGGAALDVLAGDGRWNRVPDGHPLVEYARTQANLILTPHVGGWSRTAVEATGLFVARRFAELVRAAARAS